MNAAGAAGRIPVTIFTGFLGSGKTTLLNRVLRDPRMANAAVIINEFGEIGLDHLLVTAPQERMVLLENGCICCTVRGDLAQTLEALHERRSEGALPPFDRVLVETTGLADPVPIMQSVTTDAALARLFRLDSVVTLVDAVHGEAQLDAHAESVKQAALADRLLLTKTDLAARATCAALRRRLARLNPAAELLEAAGGEIAPGALFGAGLADERAGAAHVGRWLAAQAFERAERDSGGRAAARGHDHDREINAFCIVHERPVTATGLVAWLNLLAGLRGANLLRVKGLLNVDGKPVAVHAVQTLIHEPLVLERWPDADRRSRLVFITRRLPRGALERTLAALELPDPRGAASGTLDPRAYANFVAAARSFQ